MKNVKIFRILLTALLCIAVLLAAGCTRENPQLTQGNADLLTASDAEQPSAAVFADGDEVGTGANALLVSVTDAQGAVTRITVHTDAANLADALLQVGLLEGEQGAYGLYIKRVNGLRADYDLDKAYWALYSNGEMLMTGASDTPIADGQHYEFVYTAG